MARTAKKKPSPRRRATKSKSVKRAGSARRKPGKRMARKSSVRRKARAA